MKFLAIFLIVFQFTSGIYCGRKALLIGIADYQNLPTSSRIHGEVISLEDLRGPMEDLKMAKRFIESIGFERGNIKILRNNEATRSQILNAIDEWLINGTREGDVVFFYFSGHGTQVPDLNGDETDGRDEALCAYDLVPIGARSIEEAKLILDDELAQKFRQLRGRKVMAVIDSCHSESTGTRGIGTQRVISVNKKYVPVELNLSQNSQAIMRGIPVMTDIPEGQIFIFSSMEDQLSFELLFEDNRYHGVFSYSLFINLRENQNITINELFKRVKNFMNTNAIKAYTLFQTPVLKPENNLILEQSLMNFLNIQESTPPQAVQVSEPSPSIVDRSGRLLIKLEDNSLRSLLSNYNFIRIVNEGYFDKLIRGSCNRRGCNLKILNRLGDTISVNSIEELKKALEYAYFAKLLLNLEDIRPEFKIKLSQEEEGKFDYRIGERIVFKFYTERDCNLFLVYADSKGDFELLFPNRFSTNNVIRAGSTVYIPSEEQNFDLEITEPIGEDTIKAVCIRNNDSLRGIRPVERGEFISSEIDDINSFYNSLRENILSQDTIVIRTYR